MPHLPRAAARPHRTHRRLATPSGQPTDQRLRRQRLRSALPRQRARRRRAGQVRPIPGLEPIRLFAS